MKKGFTLIELLAVIVILAVILIIAIPLVLKVVDNSRISAYLKNEQMVLKAVDLYVSRNTGELPGEIGSTTEVSINYLISNGMLTEITNPYNKNEDCTGYVTIMKLSDTEYDYTPHLKCGLDIHDSSDDGLVGHWKLDGGLAIDYSANNNSGTVNGAVSTLDRFGRNDRALNFSGNNSVIVSNRNFYNFSSFSISMWVNYRDYTYPKTFGAISKSSPACFTTGGRGWDFGHSYNSSGVDVCISDGINRVRTILMLDTESRPPQLLNKWTNIFLVINRQNNTVSAYINGKRQSHVVNISSVTGDISNPANIIIGTLYGWQTDGVLDDVRIYNRALSEQEIIQIYNSQK